MYTSYNPRERQQLLNYAWCIGGPADGQYVHIENGESWPYVQSLSDYEWIAYIYEIDTLDDDDSMLVYRMTHVEEWPRHPKLHGRRDEIPT